LEIEAIEEESFDELGFYQVGMNAQEGLMGKDDGPLPDRPYVAAEAEPRKIIEKSFFEAAQLGEPGDVLRQESKTLQIPEEGFESRKNRKTAGEGVAAEKILENGARPGT
jgi:hypothetical protein